MRRAVPALLLMVPLLASAGGGLGGWQLNRYEHRQEVAAAKARVEAAAARAAKAYREGLAPLVADLADVFAVEELIESGDARARADLAAAVRLDQVTIQAKTRLAALVVPGRLADQGRAVTEAMAEVSGATAALQAAGRAVRAGHASVGAVDTALDQVRSGSDSWTLAVQRLLGARIDAYSQRSHGLRDAARFLLGVDSTCAEGSTAIGLLPVTTLAQYKKNGDAFADAVTRTVNRLRGQLASRPGTAALQQQLVALLPFAEGMHEELQGVRHRSFAEIDAGYRKTKAARAHLDPASTGFARLGASWCATYFSNDRTPSSRSVTA